MINVVCADNTSWRELLRLIPVRQRFSEPGSYDQGLLDRFGRPLLVVSGNIRIHVYPAPMVSEDI